MQEKAAEPREGAPLDEVTLWFADTAAGLAHRQRIRSELAAGRAVDVACDADVGLDAGRLPDRFTMLADADGIMRNGAVSLGLTDPLVLELGMDRDGGPLPTVSLPMYRIPSDPGYSISYGGSFHGALLFLDVDPTAERPDRASGNWTETSIAFAIDSDGVEATELVTGLGFLLSFARADRLHLACDGLLPPEGMDLDITDHGIDGENAAILEHAIIVSAVLADLTRLDGLARVLGPIANEYDRRIANLVGDLLRNAEIRTPLNGPYRYSIPDDARHRDPGELMRGGVRRALGPLAGQPTVVAELRIDGDADGRLLEIDGTTVLEATRATAATPRLSWLSWGLCSRTLTAQATSRSLTGRAAAGRSAATAPGTPGARSNVTRGGTCAGRGCVPTGRARSRSDPRHPCRRGARNHPVRRRPGAPC